jgi:hypothetical protein
VHCDALRFPFQLPAYLLRGYRNAGDAHAAGAELQRSPKERKKNNQNPFFTFKSGSDFGIKTGSRFVNENRGSILKWKSGSDFKIEIADRF